MAPIDAARWTQLDREKARTMLRHRNEFPAEGDMPDFDGATHWLNSGPMSVGGLRGRVVLVSFGTYTCINWIRSLPYVRAWADTYAGAGLAVVGVQTPEFDFEHDLADVKRSLEEMDVRYPVAVDNDDAVWRAFDNHYWPALYFVDAQGRIRHHHVGEGEYEASEMVLQMLLRGRHRRRPRARPHRARRSRGRRRLGEPRVTGDVPRLWPRAAGFASPREVAPDEAHVYSAPSHLRRNRWALSGDWAVGEVPALLARPGGAITYQFHARDVHLVMGPPAGRAPRGVDVDEDGAGSADYQRLYQLTRQPSPIGERRFDIEFLDAGVEAFVFTFG